MKSKKEIYFDGSPDVITFGSNFFLMVRRFLFVLALFFIPSQLFPQGHTTVSANAPRLIVGIVIEDMNPDYIDRYWDKFSESGFRKLYTNGFICANHHYDNLLQRPSVNMATLSTGTTPSQHGIVNDFWIDVPTKKQINCINDEYYTTVGSDSREGNKSSLRLMTPTLGDRLKIVTSGKSKIFSIAMNDVSAVFAAGHAADGAYWFDYLTGKMISSSYFMQSFPKWAFDYNELKMPDSYISSNWTTLQESDTYYESLKGMDAREQSVQIKKSSFPYNLSKLKKENGGNYRILKATPFSNTIVKDFALQMIPKEQLGYDMIPDLLTVIFSSMDYERYDYGPFSMEMEDLYLRLDKDIATLLKYLEDGYGTQNILIYLSGLTSISYSSDYLKQKFRMTSGNFSPDRSIALLKSYLNVTYGQGDWVELFANQNIYLNHSLIETKKLRISDVQRTVATFINQFEGIAYAKASCEIEADNFLGGGPLEAFRNNYYLNRSGDVMIKYQDGWMPIDKYRPPDYTENNHVSLVWYGAGIKRGTTFRRTNATDIVPTISALIGIAPPNSTTGKVIEELIRN